VKDDLRWTIRPKSFSGGNRSPAVALKRIVRGTCGIPTGALPCVLNPEERAPEKGETRHTRYPLPAPIAGHGAAIGERSIILERATRRAPREERRPE